MIDAELAALEQEYLHRIGARLAELRGFHGLSTRALTELCGVDYSRIAKLEKGLPNALVSTLARLADALDVPIYELLTPPEIHQVTGPEDVTRSRPRPSDPKREARVPEVLEHMGRRIADFRTLQGLTLAEVEEYAGVPASRLSQIERGRGDISIRTAIHLADGLGVRLHELFVPAELSEIRVKSGGERRNRGRKKSNSR